MDKMSSHDMSSTISRYSQRYGKYGYSPKSLGWLKGKQDIRFDVLTSQYDFYNKRILDIGCGFGDLNKVMQVKFSEYSYIGCDLCQCLLAEAKKRYPNASFVEGDFLQMEFPGPIDWAVASGPFNHKFEEMDNYDFIESVMKKTHQIVNDGFSFDFISNKVDYEDEHVFYAAPEMILGLAYKFSRNVVLRSDYMPFEFSLFVYKDDSFSRDDTIFNRYKDENIR